MYPTFAIPRQQFRGPLWSISVESNGGAHAKAILMLLVEGKKISDISTEYGVSRVTLYTT